MLSYKRIFSCMYSVPTNLATLIIAMKARLAAFLFVFFLTFVAAYLLLSAAHAVPESSLALNDVFAEADAVVDPTVADEVTDDSEEAVALPPEHVMPLSIRIDKLDRTLVVNNPTSRAVADLDAALLTGVVRHPDSSTFGQEGTMFILGHSSYLPSVRNRYFQAFNGIQNLEWGDTITVASADRAYVYQVDRVYKARAEEVSVPITGTGARLTLATCNSFGTKDDRYIVEATLLHSEALPTA